jgi:14-3-3 protein epsilon
VEANGYKHLQLLKDYKKKIVDELHQFCNDILELIDLHLIKNSTSAEQKVFFLKMKGDYNRYIAEFTQGQSHQNSSDSALEAYKKASDLACQYLKTTHPVRLGLALNFSVF